MGTRVEAGGPIGPRSDDSDSSQGVRGAVAEGLLDSELVPVKEPT